MIVATVAREPAIPMVHALVVVIVAFITTVLRVAIAAGHGEGDHSRDGRVNRYMRELVSGN